MENYEIAFRILYDATAQALTELERLNMGNAMSILLHAQKSCAAENEKSREM